MKQKPKKQLTLIKISLLLLTALCANVHASTTSGTQKKLTKAQIAAMNNQRKVLAAVILHSIDTSSCYDWLIEMKKENLPKISDLLSPYLIFKIIYLVDVARMLFVNNKVSLALILLSKLATDLLARTVRNTKIATIVSHWSLGLIATHLYILVNQPDVLINTKESWNSGMYSIFISTFCRLYLLNLAFFSWQDVFYTKVQKFTGKKISQVLFYIMVLTINLGFNKEGELFCRYFPFAILLLEYYRVALDHYSANKK